MTECDPEDIKSLEWFSREFDLQMVIELDKFNSFFHLKLMDCYRKWILIKLNIVKIRKMKLKHNFDEYSDRLKTSFHIFYKEIRMLKDFVDINNEAMRKIIKKHKKKVKIFKVDCNLHKRLEKRRADCFVSRNIAKLYFIMEDVEDNYIEFFYHKYNANAG